VDRLLKRFATAPEAIAFVHENISYSYKDVLKTVDDFSETLRSLKIESGQTVVVVCDYSPEVFCLFLSLANINCIIVPLSNSAVVEEKDLMAVCGCDWRISFDSTGLHFQAQFLGISVDNELVSELRRRQHPGLVMFSSGSTGKPKGILHDFHTVVSKFEKQRSPIIAIPFLLIDHFGGVNTILSILASLGTAVTVADRSVEKICNAIAEYRIELLPTTPSFLTLMLASGAHKNYDLSSLTRVTYGTEVMPQTTLDRMHNILPNAKFSQTYGLSEVGVLRSQSRSDGSLWMRIGGDGFQTKVVDGILWIKSEYAMLGYLNAPSEFDSDGWFNTQDQVEVDGEFFKILGRVTDLINVGGQKVYPSEVENVILQMDNIEDVAVFGEVHKLLGSIVVAKVSLASPESLNRLKIRIRAFCKLSLLPYKIPVKIVMSDTALYNERQKKVRR